MITRPKPGEWVKVITDPYITGKNRKARIIGIYKSIPGGVMLHTPVLGFQSCHVTDLVRCRPPKEK